MGGLAFDPCSNCSDGSRRSMKTGGSQIKARLEACCFRSAWLAVPHTASVVGDSMLILDAEQNVVPVRIKVDSDGDIHERDPAPHVI